MSARAEKRRRTRRRAARATLERLAVDRNLAPITGESSTSLRARVVEGYALPRRRDRVFE